MDDKEKKVNQPGQPDPKDVANGGINDVSKPFLPPKFYERSEAITQLAKALSEAQGEFTNVDKDASNPFFKSKYAPLDSVVSMARPILAKHGLSVTQLTNSPDEMKVSIKTILLHTSGEYIASVLIMKSKEATAQAAGSVITYGRRYSYMAILGLVASEEDDDGNAAANPSGNEPKGKTSAKPAAPEKKLITSAQLKALNAVMSEKNITKEMVYKKYSVSSLKDLTIEQASTAIDAISKIEPKEIVDPDEIDKGMEEEKKKAEKEAEEKRRSEPCLPAQEEKAQKFIEQIKAKGVESVVKVEDTLTLTVGQYEDLWQQFREVVMKVEKTS